MVPLQAVEVLHSLFGFTDVSVLFVLVVAVLFVVDVVDFDDAV